MSQIGFLQLNCVSFPLLPRLVVVVFLCFPNNLLLLLLLLLVFLATRLRMKTCNWEAASTVNNNNCGTIKGKRVFRSLHYSISCSFSTPYHRPDSAAAVLLLFMNCRQITLTALLPFLRVISSGRELGTKSSCFQGNTRRSSGGMRDEEQQPPLPLLSQSRANKR